MKLVTFISALVLLISCSCGGKSGPYSEPTRKPNKVVRKQVSVKEEKKIVSNIKHPFNPPVIPVIPIITDPEPFLPIVGCGYYPPDCPTYDTVKTTSDFVLQFAEIMPEFPGGSQSMLEFIQKNLIYPDIAKENNIEGKVFMKFVVRSTGEIDNIQIVRGVHKILDTAAIELVKKMPQWIPGVQNGKTVPVYFILPVVFRLD